MIEVNCQEGDVILGLSARNAVGPVRQLIKNTVNELPR